MAHLQLIHLQLTHQYQQEVISKLPPLSILTTSVLKNYPLGSNVSLVPETCGLLSPEQIKITRMDATELLDKMAKGLLKSEQVVLAFGMRAAIAHQLVCCLTDIWLDEALVRARELDAIFEATGKTVGPYHGLPISLKDMLNVEGKITSLSLLSLHQSAVPCSTNAHLVQILQDAGAIFYCHTTLPQTIMTLECDSFWGRTLNPFNTSLTSGGSSGGEGALMGMRGSVLGFADIGGSVRTPASLNNLYGLRPTALRIPMRGCGSYTYGRDSILGTIGPLTHSLRDLENVMKFLCSDKGKESIWKKEVGLLEMSWGGDSTRRGDWGRGRKLRVGVMRNDGVVRPLRPIERILEEVVGKLEKSGEVELVEMEGWKSKEGWELIRKLYFPDGGKRAHDLLDRSSIGEELKALTKWLLEEAGPHIDEITDIHELWKLNAERDTFRSQYSEYWESKNIDVLLCPAGPGPAPKHGESKYWAYTSTFNLVDYPCIAFPYKTVDTGLDQQAGYYVPLSEDDRILHHNYTPSDYENAPLSLQLVAKRFRDEELLDALALIETIITRN